MTRQDRFNIKNNKINKQTEILEKKIRATPQN